MFHNLLFLGPGGRTVFQGGVDEAEMYFSKLGFKKPANVNPADFYMDVIGGVYETDGFDQNQLFQEYKQYQMERDGGEVHEDQGITNEAADHGENDRSIVNDKMNQNLPQVQAIDTVDSIQLKSFKKTYDFDENKPPSCPSGKFA